MTHPRSRQLHAHLSSSPHLGDHERSISRGRQTMAACALALVLSLQGCSLGKSYQQIDPEGADREVKAHNGYMALKNGAAPGTAKLVMRPEGAPESVRFATSTSPSNCQGFGSDREMMEMGRGVLLPSIAKLVSEPGRPEYLESNLTPGESIQVRAYVSSIDVLFNPMSFRNCGPRTARFTPKEGHAYLARLLIGEACMLVIDDATDPDALRPIEVEIVPACKRP